MHGAVLLAGISNVWVVSGVWHGPAVQGLGGSCLGSVGPPGAGGFPCYVGQVFQGQVGQVFSARPVLVQGFSAGC